MEFDTIVNMIGSVGFPIVMCIMLFNYIKTEQAQTRQVLEDVKDSIDALTIFIKKEGGKNDV